VEEANRWLSTTEEFVSCLFEALNNQGPVLSKAGRVNSFSPELSSNVRLAEHRPCSLNQHAVASFSDSSLPRSSDRRDFLRDSFLLKELIKGAVFEFSAMITSDRATNEVVNSFHFLEIISSRVSLLDLRKKTQVYLEYS